MQTFKEPDEFICAWCGEQKHKSNNSASLPKVGKIWRIWFCDDECKQAYKDMNETYTLETCRY